ncbi:MAG TPA: hypothetical protein VGQ83_02825 [Polyangia bacterium]
MPLVDRIIALLTLALVACGGRAGIGSGPADGGSPGDAGADAPLADFCTGSFNHMVVNGIDSNPSVSGRPFPMDCCEAAELVVVTQTFAQIIIVSWRAQVGMPTALPATIDLANPPEGWGVQVLVGCDPAQGSCYPLPDSYTTGLTGTLQVARTGAGGYDMSLCLSVAEPAGSPHPLVHSLELYAPHVTAAY